MPFKFTQKEFKSNPKSSKVLKYNTKPHQTPECPPISPNIDRLGHWNTAEPYKALRAISNQIDPYMDLMKPNAALGSLGHTNGALQKLEGPYGAEGLQQKLEAPSGPEGAQPI